MITSKSFTIQTLRRVKSLITGIAYHLKAKMFIELKSRKTHYPDLLIEESKYQGLLLAAGIRSLTPWYINATPEGIWGFNLTDYSSA